VQILHAPTHDRGAYADGKMFMKFRITAAWEGGKVYATPPDTDVAVEMAMSDDTIVTAYDINSISDGN